MELEGLLEHRQSLNLRALGTDAPSLRIQVYNLNRDGAFVLFNTHSCSLDPAPFIVPRAPGQRVVSTNANAILATAGRGDGEPEPPDFDLTALYKGQTEASDITRPLLKPILPTWPVITNHPTSLREDPFLAINYRHGFYVDVREKLVPIWNSDVYGAVQAARIAGDPNIPAVIDKPQALQIPERPSWGAGGDIGVDNQDAISQFVTEDAYIRRGLATSGTVTFGGVRIGPAGSIPDREKGQ